MSAISIPIGLRITLIVVSLLVLILVVFGSVKEKMEIRYAILWISWAIIILIFAVFPGLAMDIARAMGIYSVTTFLFLVMIALLFMLCYYLFLETSRLRRDIRNLNYETASLKEQLEEKDKNGK
jgi:hypothetical protein